MTATETALAVLAVAAFAAFVIALAYARTEARDADNLAAKNGQLTREKADLEAKVRHYQERNAELRDELDAFAAAPEPSLVEAVTADLAAIDITYRGDLR